MPIEHLELSDLTEVKIGSVRIVPFNTLMAENERIKKLNEYIYKEYADKICGELFVKGESDEAISKGKIGLEQVINLLRAYIPIIYKRDNDKKIGLTKYDLKSHECLIIDGLNNITSNGLNLGPFGNYILTKKYIII